LTPVHCTHKAAGANHISAHPHNREITELNTQSFFYAISVF